DGRTNDAQTWYGGHDATRLSPAARRVASFCSRDAGFAVRQALVQRRITSRVRFAKADEAQRLALWRHLLPRGARLADDVDLARLSTDFEMEGAHVQRALARAAFRVRAAGGSEPILGGADLEWAARVEYEDRAGSRTRSGAASRLRVRGRRDEARQGADLGLLLARAHGLVARLVDLVGIGPLLDAELAQAIEETLAVGQGRLGAVEQVLGQLAPEPLARGQRHEILRRLHALDFLGDRHLDAQGEGPAGVLRQAALDVGALLVRRAHRRVDDQRRQVVRGGPAGLDGGPAGTGAELDGGRRIGDRGRRV